MVTPRSLRSHLVGLMWLVSTVTGLTLRIGSFHLSSNVGNHTFDQLGQLIVNYDLLLVSMDPGLHPNQDVLTSKRMSMSYSHYEGEVLHPYYTGNFFLYNSQILRLQNCYYIAYFEHAVLNACTVTHVSDNMWSFTIIGVKMSHRFSRKTLSVILTTVLLQLRAKNIQHPVVVVGALNIHGYKSFDEQDWIQIGYTEFVDGNGKTSCGIYRLSRDVVICYGDMITASVEDSFITLDNIYDSHPSVTPQRCPTFALINTEELARSAMSSAQLKADKNFQSESPKKFLMPQGSMTFRGWDKNSDNPTEAMPPNVYHTEEFNMEPSETSARTNPLIHRSFNYY